MRTVCQFTLELMGSLTTQLLSVRARRAAYVLAAAFTLIPSFDTWGNRTSQAIMELSFLRVKATTILKTNHLYWVQGPVFGDGPNAILRTRSGHWSTYCSSGVSSMFVSPVPPLQFHTVVLTSRT